MLKDNAGAVVRADAAPSGTQPEDKMDRILQGIGTLSGRLDADERARADSTKTILDRLDSMDKRLDACESDSKARKDADDKASKEKEEKERADAEAKDKEEKERADKARKDAEEEEEAKKRADAARGSDPTLAARLQAIENRLPGELSAEERPKFVAAQVRAERVAQAFGDSEGAPRWMNGESLPDYQRRLLGKYKVHSAHWKEKELARVDASVLDIAETQIYADAMQAARSPTGLEAGTLQMRTRRDETGREIREFFGDPEACWGPFKQPVRAITGWQTKFN